MHLNNSPQTGKKWGERGREEAGGEESTEEIKGERNGVRETGGGG